MEYRALSQNTYVFTKTTTINGAMDISDPYSPRIGGIKYNVDGVDNYAQLIPIGNDESGGGSFSTESSSFPYGYGYTSCVVDGITYRGTRCSKFLVRRFQSATTLTINGTIKMVIYNYNEGTIGTIETPISYSGTVSSSNGYLYYYAKKSNNDIILSMTYESAAE